MISRFVRFQLLIFGAAGLVVLMVITLVYGQVPQLLGFGEKTVTARFADAAGLTSGTKVSYEGTEVGRVTEVAPEKDGVRVRMLLDNSYRIPASSTAEIHSESAIGIQYVDFVPGKDPSGPALADGADVAMNRTNVPVSIGSVLESANQLLESVPKQSLRTALDELTKAFRGTGPALSRSLNNAEQLIRTAQDNVGPTKDLIRRAGPLLKTQTDTASNIRSLANSLSSFGDRVWQSDGDLRKLLDHGAPAAEQVDGLFQDLKPTLPILLSDLVNVGQTLVTYNPSVEQLLVLYPRMTTAFLSASEKTDGHLRLDLRTQVQATTPCTKGFLPPGKQLPPASLYTPPVQPNLYCKLQHQAQTVVRGARNLKCMAGDGQRAPNTKDCLGSAYEQRYRQAGTAAGASGNGRDKAVGVGDYSPSSGTAEAPDGALYAVGGIGTPAHGKEESNWQSILLRPISP
ncbi:MCE family protein [Sciscionella marina]|uniref:MCE family protein n=1 Tax=Sciscionella marina TaxID=508770 RepID=UPI00037C18A7|nr:MlaD family protein [Sciscionella marina]